MENDRNKVRSHYKGLYIGPFRRKIITRQSNIDEVIKKETREVDFDIIFSEVKSYIEAWGRKHECDIVFSKAEYKMYSGLIDDNVKRHIEMTDFVIADISGDNRNALLELGYADGKLKPYVIMSQGAIDIQLPTDKQGRIIAHYDPTHLERLKDSLRVNLEYLINDVDERRDADNYTIQCFSSRDVRMIDEKIHKSRYCIHILQTNLETLNANHLGHIKARMCQSDDLRLRMLTLDPQSTYVNERAKQLGRSGDGIGVYRNGLMISLDQAKLELDTLKERVMIKVYDDFPTQMTYRFDNELQVCVVSRITKSRENCTFLIDNITKKGINQSFIRHFKAIWESPSARTVFGELPDDELLDGPCPETPPSRE